MDDSSPRYQLRLIDVAAVVVCIMVFAAVLLPKLGDGHTTSKRNVCRNNEKQLSLALLNFESSRRRFPGYANSVNAREVSYFVLLLPYIERNDLWNQWSGSGGKFPQAAPFMELVVCSSDGRSLGSRKAPTLSYVLNGGEADRENIADGIAFNQCQPAAVKVNLEYITDHDGAAYTLLLSESTNAANWNTLQATALRAGTTMVWHRSLPVEPAWQINGPKITRPVTHWLDQARPSSNHLGGVNVQFADGHLGFLAEDIDYAVYRQLLTPNDAESRDPEHRQLPESEY